MFNVHSLAGAQQNLMVRISVPAHKFGGETFPKKGLRSEILGLVMAFTCVFRPGTRLYSRVRGAQAVIWGVRPRNAIPWRRVCVIHAIEYNIATYLLQARKHQLLNARSAFLSKLDEIIAEA